MEHGEVDNAHVSPIMSPGTLLHPFACPSLSSPAPPDVALFSRRPPNWPCVDNQWSLGLMSAGVISLTSAWNLSH